MVQVDIKKQNKIYKSLETSGHALYDTYGSDIVCASASMLIINTINSIEKFTDDKIRVDADKETGFIHLEFESPASEKSCLLLDSMLLGLETTKEQYGDVYLKINIQEV